MDQKGLPVKDATIDKRLWQRMQELMTEVDTQGDILDNEEVEFNNERKILDAIRPHTDVPPVSKWTRSVCASNALEEAYKTRIGLRFICTCNRPGCYDTSKPRPKLRGVECSDLPQCDKVHSAVCMDHYPESAHGFNIRVPINDSSEQEALALKQSVDGLTWIPRLSALPVDEAKEAKDGEPSLLSLLTPKKKSAPAPRTPPFRILIPMHANGKEMAPDAVLRTLDRGLKSVSTSPHLGSGPIQMATTGWETANAWNWCFEEIHPGMGQVPIEQLVMLFTSVSHHQPLKEFRDLIVKQMRMPLVITIPRGGTLQPVSPDIILGYLKKEVPVRITTRCKQPRERQFQKCETGIDVVNVWNSYWSDNKGGVEAKIAAIMARVPQGAATEFRVLFIRQMVSSAPPPTSPPPPEASSSSIEKTASESFR